MKSSRARRNQFRKSITHLTDSISDPETNSPPARRASDYVALAVATCGVGYLPLAPGTWGSLLAVAVYVYAQAALLGGSIDNPVLLDFKFFFMGQLIAIVIITVVGIWAASRTERVLNLKDPGKVVIDEVAGQLIALLPLPLMMAVLPWSWIHSIGEPIQVLAAFLFFRLFDIVKPYPARKLESLHGGLGIMADDLIAGVYAAIIVAILVVIRSYM